MDLGGTGITGLVGAAVAVFSAVAAWTANRKTSQTQARQVEVTGQTEGQRVTLEGYKAFVADLRAENERLQQLVNDYRERDRKHIEDKERMAQQHADLEARHHALLELHEDLGEQLEAARKKERRAR